MRRGRFILCLLVVLLLMPLTFVCSQDAALRDLPDRADASAVLSESPAVPGDTPALPDPADFGGDVEVDPSAATAEGTVLVRDEAGIFDAPVHSELGLILLRLKRDTGVELFLVTRCLDSIDDTELVAYDLFKSLVREVQHYKVILVLIAIDRKSGLGVVSTNLGAGVYHLVNREECRDLFVSEGGAFSPDHVKQGIVWLCERIRAVVEERRRADMVTGIADEPEEKSSAALWVILALSVFVIALVLLWYFAIRTPHCPKCGARLRTRVNIVVGTGGADVARKTFKCFKCGFVKKRALLPTSLFSGGKNKNG